MPDAPNTGDILDKAIAESTAKEKASVGAASGTRAAEEKEFVVLADELASTSLRAEEQQHKNKKLEEENKSFADTRELRKRLGYWTFVLISVWTAFLISFVWMSGFKCYGFVLPDPVFIAYLTTTTVAVIGLPLAVLQGLFKAQGEKK